MANFAQQMAQQVGAAHSKIGVLAQRIQQNEGEAALVRQQLVQMDRDMRQLAAIAANVQTSGGGGDERGKSIVRDRDKVLYIDQIPGRRMPYDLILQVAVGANVVEVLPQTATISQDGPFVAVLRGIAFESRHTSSVMVSGVRATFQGRTNGRFRPTSSVWDFMDSQAFQPVVGVANPGTGAGVYASPSNHSGARSMEFDGLVSVINEGSGWFRSNIPVPSCFFSDGLNSCFQLGSLDFFERGETVKVEITPTHINNPLAGNVALFLAGGVYPPLGSQYDVHEGILDPFVPAGTADPVTRVPEGIVSVILHGFRILQPPGPVQMG